MRTSLETSNFPLVFRIGNAAEIGLGADVPADAAVAGEVRLRTLTRALVGMQKEAIVCQAGGDAWRMVCDEGPYLNGTDLAPFPLAFFTAGLAADIFSGVRAQLRDRGIDARGLTLTQDNCYTMEGSALQGTMTGGALPVALSVSADSGLDAETSRAVLTAATRASPACALLRAVLENRFSIHHNGRYIVPGRVSGADDAGLRSHNVFDRALPESPRRFALQIIDKVAAAQSVFGVEGGAGSSLHAEQKRQLHVRGSCTLQEDELMTIRVQLLKPIGSVFQFLAEHSAEAVRAPTGLMYLSAGIAFCYMTQLGRYAHIVRKPLQDYRIVQDTGFGTPGAAAISVTPVDTHVFVETAEDDAYARQLVDMGEQTCFLHAACRASVGIQI